MEKFFDAIRNGNAKKVGLMLALGQNPNVKDSDGFSPLNVAISKLGNRYNPTNPIIKIINMLISAGADVNAVEVDSYGAFDKPIPLLHSAIFQGEPEIVNMLILAGANVNAVDEYGSSPLHVAADENPRITSILISAGANVNAVDKDGNSVLHRAVFHGDEEDNNRNAEIINMLISAGADVTATNKEGKTALELMH